MNPCKPSITRLQALTLRYLDWHIWRFEYAPTRQELAQAFSTTESAICRRLHKLEKKGYLRLEKGWRGLKLL